MAKMSQTKLDRFLKHPETAKNDPDYPIFQAGVEEGIRRGKSLALGFLEPEYMSPEVTRDSPKGQAILEVVAKLAAFLKAN